jgi:hypothetical protein
MLKIIQADHIVPKYGSTLSLGPESISEGSAGLSVTSGECLMESTGLIVESDVAVKWIKIGSMVFLYPLGPTGTPTGSDPITLSSLPVELRPTSLCYDEIVVSPGRDGGGVLMDRRLGTAAVNTDGTVVISGNHTPGSSFGVDDARGINVGIIKYVI